MNIEKVIQILINEEDDKKAEGFLKFLSTKLWGLYDEYMADQELIIRNEVNQLPIMIPNAKENKHYEATVVIPSEKMVEISLIGLKEEEHGLSIEKQEDGRTFRISGKPKPSVAGTFELKLEYKYAGFEERKPLERTLQMIINPDPRRISDERMQPVDWDSIPEPKYHNEDTQKEFVKVEAKRETCNFETEEGEDIVAVETPQKNIVAASTRGRSHSWEAKPRDDHFKMKYLENGWYVIAVADGAGSAKYSREGSRIACETVVDYCESQLQNIDGLETAIDNYNIAQYNSLEEVGEGDARKIVGDMIYNIVGTAAFKAHKAINAEASNQNLAAKNYATTLLLTICKRFEYGWFVASFWVGDGAICLYEREAHRIKLLGVPDEGEYAGQTRFLTMPEIFKDAVSIYQRLRFYVVSEFTALFLMTDGVSDPMFETDANLNNPEKWDAFWENLTQNEDSPVNLADENENAADQLLEWLDFWVPGNHDDRTIAILY